MLMLLADGLSFEAVELDPCLLKLGSRKSGKQGKRKGQRWKEEGRESEGRGKERKRCLRGGVCGGR